MDPLTESQPAGTPDRANDNEESNPESPSSPQHTHTMTSPETQPLETQLPEIPPATEEPKQSSQLQEQQQQQPDDRDMTSSKPPASPPRKHSQNNDEDSVKVNDGSPGRKTPAIDLANTGVITMPRMRDQETTTTNNDNVNDDPATLDSVQVRIEDPPVPPPPSSFPPPPLPLKQRELSRARSLSRVFNSVPADRPNCDRAQHDLMEYYCHLAILQTNPERVVAEEQNVLSVANGSWRFRKYGRLYSRMQVACLSLSMGSVQTSPAVATAMNAEERHEQQTTSWPSLKGQPRVLLAKNVTSTMWKEFKKDLINLRNNLLRKDANTYVPVQRRFSNEQVNNEDDQSIPPQDTTLDLETEKHVMFQGDYKLVLHLLDVHAVCQKFREDLQAIFQDPDESSNTQIRNAADAYEQELDDIFDKYHEGIPAERIPRALKNFVLKDLFQQRKHPAEVAEKLYNDSLQVAQEGTTRMYCFANVKTKVHDILLKWSESILEPPTLIQLGYGGVDAPLAADEHEEDDVSSYGLDETAANDDGDEIGSTSTDELIKKSPPKQRARGKSDSIVRHRRPHTSSTAERRFSIPFGRSTDADDEKRQQNSFSDDNSSKKSDGDPMTLGDDESDDEEKTPNASALVQLKEPAKKSESPSKGRRHPGKMPRRSSTETEVSTNENASHKKRKTANEWAAASALDSTSDSDDDYEWMPDRKEEDEREPEVDRGQPAKSSKRHPRGHIDTGNSTQEEEDLWRDDDDDDDYQGDADTPHNMFRRKKVPWTQEEADAVYDGYHRFGTKWVMVKANDPRLARRTEVQIKDKFRTMVNQGLIEEKK